MDYYNRFIEVKIMPVYKFKSFEDSRRALWYFNPDAEYLRRTARLFEIGFRLAPPVCRRGVFYFRNIDEANAFDKNKNNYK